MAPVIVMEGIDRVHVQNAASGRRRQDFHYVRTPLEQRVVASRPGPAQARLPFLGALIVASVQTRGGAELHRSTLAWPRGAAHALSSKGIVVAEAGLTGDPRDMPNQSLCRADPKEALAESTWTSAKRSHRFGPFLFARPNNYELEEI